MSANQPSAQPKQESHYTDSEKLLELGLFFADESLKLLRENDETALKINSAILNLFTAAELIMKALLLRAHWALIFEDVNAATLSAYEKDDFKAVGFDAGLNRLENLGLIKIHENQTKLLNDLRKMRNAIVHRGSWVDTRAAASTAHKSLGVLLSFARKYFKDTFAQSIMDEYLTEHLQYLATNGNYKKARWKILEQNSPELFNKGMLVKCHVCKETSVEISEGYLTCHICDCHADDPSKFIEFNCSNRIESFTVNHWRAAEESEGCCFDQCVTYKIFDNGETLDDAKLCFVCGKWDNSLATPKKGST